MKSISVIPPVKRKANNVVVQNEEKLRVAAYCRVSTDNEEQLSSYEAQVEHYTKYINANPAWTLAGIYADEAISACNTKKRLDFHRLIDDCEAERILKEKGFSVV